MGEAMALRTRREVRRALGPQGLATVQKLGEAVAALNEAHKGTQATVEKHRARITALYTSVGDLGREVALVRATIEDEVQAELVGLRRLVGASLWERLRWVLMGRVPGVSA